MDELRLKAKELLENNTVQVVIGYGEGINNKPKAIFVRKPEDVKNLIYDERCKQNLAVYLLKHEVKHLGKIAIQAPYPVLRGIMQLASENQIKEGEIVILGVSPEGKLTELADFKSVEKYVATFNLNITDEEKALIKKIEAMTVEQRWEYWTNMFSKCFKCYACRSACPMCYCSRCTVEVNQPQWIPVASHTNGNLEWHIMRAMHLAGRCINCGDCARVCPLEIPLNLLTYKLIEDINIEFGVTAGTSAEYQSALSTYKPDDKETFIK